MERASSPLKCLFSSVLGREENILPVLREDYRNEKILCLKNNRAITI